MQYSNRKSEFCMSLKECLNLYFASPVSVFFRWFALVNSRPEEPIHVVFCVMFKALFINANCNIWHYRATKIWYSIHKEQYCRQNYFLLWHWSLWFLCHLRPMKKSHHILHFFDKLPLVTGLFYALFINNV